MVTVRDDIIEGLPSRASPALRRLIKDKAEARLASLEKTDDATDHRTGALEPRPTEREPVETPVSRNALYEHDDLIIDGPAHSAILERVIRNASERLIIHSTFITDTRAQLLVPLLLQAAAKGVAVDIFLGARRHRE